MTTISLDHENENETADGENEKETADNRSNKIGT